VLGIEKNLLAPRWRWWPKSNEEYPELIENLSFTCARAAEEEAFAEPSIVIGQTGEMIERWLLQGKSARGDKAFIIYDKYGFRWIGQEFAGKRLRGI
jgi:hypothetical protein